MEKKSRAERETELRAMWNRPGGPEKLMQHLHKLQGIPEGAMGPVGVPVIQTILQIEYPEEK